MPADYYLHCHHQHHHHNCLSDTPRRRTNGRRLRYPRRNLTGGTGHRSVRLRLRIRRRRRSLRTNGDRPNLVAGVDLQFRQSRPIASERERRQLFNAGPSSSPSAGRWQRKSDVQPAPSTRDGRDERLDFYTIAITNTHTHTYILSSELR